MSPTLALRAVRRRQWRAERDAEEAQAIAHARRIVAETMRYRGIAPTYGGTVQ